MRSERELLKDMLSLIEKLKQVKDFRKDQGKRATSQKPLRGKMKATTASLASQPIACGC